MQAARRYAQAESAHIDEARGVLRSGNNLRSSCPSFVNTEQTHAHPDGSGVNAGMPSSAQRANILAPDAEHKKIKAIDEKIGAGEKGIDVSRHRRP
jgi:hypothetical protein